ncbi:MAG: bifunctional precorrin-2 dehydrogenase/sirohydrochlorin ferrochelatase [Bacillota bacterium]
MRLYPLALDVEGRECLVVGGGPVALRKARSLLQCGASVTLVCPGGLAGSGVEGAVVVSECYSRAHLKGAFLAIAAATREVNEAVRRDARGMGVLVNVADDLGGSTFILPASARKGPFTLSLSTGGRSPLLAARLVRELADSIPASMERLCIALRWLRPQLKEIDPGLRRQVLDMLADPGLAREMADSVETALARRLDGLPDLVRTIVHTGFLGGVAFEDVEDRDQG